MYQAAGMKALRDSKKAHRSMTGAEKSEIYFCSGKVNTNSRPPKTTK